jgi:hypothetical protein
MAAILGASSPAGKLLRPTALGLGLRTVRAAVCDLPEGHRMEFARRVIGDGEATASPCTWHLGR